MTDKTIMENKYLDVVDRLDDAYDCLNEAEKILRTSIIIDHCGYYANDISERKTKIYNYRQDVINRILPEIRKL